MRFKWDEEQSGSSGLEPRATRERGSTRDRVCADLERRGVGAELSVAIAAHLDGRLDRSRPGIYDAVLDGVAAAFGAELEAKDELSSCLRELHEIEHMMKGFAGELEKLDEALEVMAAYVERMRRNATARRVRTVH